MNQSPRAASRARQVAGIAGELLLTAGVVLALFVVYQLWWTGLASADRQRVADAELSRRWSAPAPPESSQHPGVGLPEAQAGETAFARMYVPALGADYRFVIAEGTSDSVLAIGPGHYRRSQAPGEPGNFAVAGHRVGHGAPFNDLDAIAPCDALIYETRTQWLIYRVLPMDAVSPADARAQASSCLPSELAERVTSGPYSGLAGRRIVAPGEAAEIAPIPGRVGPAEPWMLALTTLTTCHPQFSAEQRLIVRGVLARAEPRRGQAVPAELAA